MSAPVRIYRLTRAADWVWQRVGELTTDSAGAGSLAAIPGVYLAVADGSALRLAHAYQQTTVAPGAATRIELTLADSKPVRGRVEEARNGSGVPLASLRLVPDGFDQFPDEEGIAAQSDSRGDFELAGLSEGQWSLQVDSDGHAPIRDREVTVPLPDPFVVTLEESIPVDGFVVNEKNEPVPNALVSFFSAGNAVQTTRTGDGGGFAFEVGQGTYRVVAQAGALVGEVPEPVSVLRGSSAQGLRIQIGSGLSLDGVVLASSTNEPVADADVWTRLAGYEGALASTRSDAEGRIHLSGLLAGSVTLSARAPGFSEGVVSLQLPSEEQAVVRLRALGALRGVVLDEQDKPLPEVRVSTLTRSLPQQERVSDAEGRFAFEGLEPGRHAVTARRGETVLREWVHVADGDGAEVTLRFARLAKLRGTVTGGAPNQELKVFAAKRTPNEIFFGVGASASVVNGRYELSVQPGDYGLYVSAATRTFFAESTDVHLEPGEEREVPLTYTPRSESGSGAVQPGTLGLAFENQAGAPRVSWIQGQGPAALAGVHLGDLLISVDGTPVKDSLHAYALTTGAAGAAASLVVRRGGSDLTLSVPRERGLLRRDR